MVVVIVTDAVVCCPSTLEEVHQGEVDPLAGQGVDDPRTAGRPDFLAGADLNRRAADEASPRTGRRRVPRHPAPITATLPDRRRRSAVAASAVH